jgi:hypothetical protein
MHPGDLLDLEVAADLAPCHILQADPIASVSTGAALWQLVGEVVVRGTTADAFRTFLRDNGTAGVWATVRSTGERLLLRSRIAQYSTSNSSTTTTFRLELLQKEILNVTELEIDTARYSTTLYEETPSERGVEIRTIVRVPGAQLDAFHRLVERGGYHAVVRHGIATDVLEMRFGAFAPWAMVGDEARYGLVLLDKRNDAAASRGSLLFHEHRVVTDHVAYRVELMEQLLAALVEKGVIAAAEVERMREVAVDGAPMRRRSMWRFNSLDGLDF